MFAVNRSSSDKARLLSLFAIATFLGFSTADAQITQGLTQASTELTKYLPLVQKIIFAIAGLVFLLGGFSVYVKMSNGDQDVKSSIMMYVGGVLFLVIVGAIAPTLFR